MEEQYFHMFANGDDAKDFIIKEEEFKAAFNRFAVCAYLCNVSILAFSIEDSHPHALLWGTGERVLDFKDKYRDLSVRYITKHRGSADGVTLNCDLCKISDEEYLRNAASYVIVQATKDGKPVLPYDYLFGTGALYFRKPGTILPWDHDFHGRLHERKKLGTFPVNMQRKICNTKIPMPDQWVIVNGFIHPGNFVDINGYERIFKTHNCFRAFMAIGKSRDEIVRRTMASAHGIVLEDLEARRLCHERCIGLFGKQTTKHLDTMERITLAQDLRKKYLLSFRQLATVVKLPESEVRKYVK